MILSAIQTFMFEVKMWRRYVDDTMVVLCDSLSDDLPLTSTPYTRQFSPQVSTRVHSNVGCQDPMKQHWWAVLYSIP